MWQGEDGVVAAKKSMVEARATVYRFMEREH